MRTAALVVCKIFSSKKNGSDQVSVLVLAVVREEERLRCFFRCKHTHRNGGVRDVHVLICTRVVQIGVADMVGQC